MAARTYLPSLLRLLRHVCLFISAHRARIIEVIGVEHTAKVDAITLACAAFEVVAEPFLEEGD